MLGYITVLLFIIAFILRVTSTGTGVVFAPESLLLVGLALLAPHVAGGESRDGAEPGAGQVVVRGSSGGHGDSTRRGPHDHKVSPPDGPVLRSSRASTCGHIVWAPIRALRGRLGWCSAAPRRDCDQPDGAIPRVQGLPESGGTVRRCGCAVCNDGRITGLLADCYLSSLAAGGG
jgi:hypothetical protein